MSTAAKVNYTFDNEEEVESDEDNEGEFKAYDAETGAFADDNGTEESPSKEKPTTNGNVSGNDSDPDVIMSSEEESKKPKAKPKPKAAPKPKASPKPKAPKEPAQPKKAPAKYVFTPHKWHSAFAKAVFEPIYCFNCKKTFFVDDRKSK